MNDSESRLSDLLDFWTAKGYTERHVFEGEYTLLINPRTMGKVRVYCNGDVWASSLKTGEYEKVTTETLSGTPTH